MPFVVKYFYLAVDALLFGMHGPSVTIVTETQRQLARLRSALDRLGDETGPTRNRNADKALYECFGALEALEREAT